MPNIQIGPDVVEITQEELDAIRYIPPATEDQIRNKRDALLAETDWWGVADRTMTQAEIDYRQALRDVPAQSGFPFEVTWPTKP